MKINIHWLRAVCCAMLCLTAASASSQSYPAKPIRIIVAYPPGGPNDISARAVGQELSKLFGQPVIVENRPGAAGNIGAQYVATSSADGYTLLNGPSALTISPALTKNLPYNVVKDFAPIGLTVVSSFVLAAHPSVPATTVKDLIALAKVRSNRLTYASSGVGAPPHLAGELLKNMAKVEILHVPYKGVGQSISDLIAGHVDMMFTSMPVAVPQIKLGRLRALGVSRMERSPLLPEVPTISESGLKGFEIGTWFGLLAPAGTPREIINRLSAATIKVVNTPNFRERMSSQGLDPESSTPEEFAAHIRTELVKFDKLIRMAGIKAE